MHVDIGALRLRRKKHLVVTVTNIHFFIRIVKEWNDLPDWVVGAGNLACFKRSLESFLNIS